MNMFILFRVVEEEKRLQAIAQFQTIERFVEYCKENDIPILLDERFNTNGSVGDGKYRLVQAGTWIDLDLPWEQQQERESMMNPLHKKFIDDYLTSEKRKKEK